MSKINSFILLFFLLASIPPVWGIGIGSPAPSCDARLVEKDKVLDIESYRGKVIYLDFWATWCPPCRKSMPFLNDLYHGLKDQGFEVIAISVDEQAEEVKPFLDRYPVDFVIARDSTGECPKKYGVMAMPSSYLIDRKGNVRVVHLGFRDEDKDAIRDSIQQLLGE